MQIILQKVEGGGLVPMHEDGHEWLHKKKPGATFKANMKSSRNPDHHRKAFALLNTVLANQDRYDNITDLLVEFKLKAGHYQEHITTKSVLMYIPKSISFDEMGQEEFEVIYNKFIDIAIQHFIGGHDEQANDDLRRELAAF
jgi:hypothetical protein